MAAKHAKNRPATSTSWKPGVSGNPAGRPPNERALANALREIVNPHEYAEVLWNLARGVDEDGLRVAEPSLPALREIGARLEGLPQASVSVDATLNPRLEILAELKRIGLEDTAEQQEGENDR